MIGATVVGAARRLEALRAAEPFAMIVEEACEVGPGAQFLGKQFLQRHRVQFNSRHEGLKKRGSDTSDDVACMVCQALVRGDGAFPHVRACRGAGPVH